MGADFRMVVELDRFEEVGAATHRLLAQAVRKAAFDLEALAKQLAPVDTGALRSSIQAVLTGELSAEVAVGVLHGIFVEFGTVHAAAQPFLGPAVERVREAFEAACAAAVLQGAGQ